MQRRGIDRRLAAAKLISEARAALAVAEAAYRAASGDLPAAHGAGLGLPVGVPVEALEDRPRGLTEELALWPAAS